MHRPFRVVAVVLVLLFPTAGLWAQSSQQYQIIEAQFDRELDEIQLHREQSNRRMLFGLTGAIAMAISGSVFATLQSAEIIIPSAGQIGTWTSAGLGAASATFAVISFVQWNRSTNEFIAIVDQQINYWNLVRR